MGGGLCSQSQKSLLVHGDTWAKDSYGLFDYESSHYTTQELELQSAGKIIRSRQEIQVVNLKTHIDKMVDDCKILLNINFIRGQFWAYNPYQDDSLIGEQPWLSLRGYTEENGYLLHEGDTIKFGRSKYIIKELISSKGEHNLSEERNIETYPYPGKVSSDPLQIHQAIEEENKDEESEKDKTFCRICLGEENEPKNPLIQSPCHCIGSLKLIHIECLKHWLKSRVKEKKGDCWNSYIWGQFECEVCKTKYPDHIASPDGKLLDIVQISKPESNYMLLEVDPSSTNGQRVVHVVLLNKKPCLRIGRGHDTDVRISDISVSRLHAEFRINKEEVYLKDHKSKFGTLFMINRPFPIVHTKQISLQTGRTLLTFTVRSKVGCPCKKNSEESTAPLLLSEDELSIVKSPIQVENQSDSIAHIIQVQPLHND